MKCKEVIEKIDLYFEKRLSDIELFNIDKHLEACNICKEEYVEYENLFSILSEHKIVTPPPDFTNNIIGKIEEEKIHSIKSPKFRFFTSTSKIGLSLVAAGLLIVALNTSHLDSGLKEFSSVFFRGPIGISQTITNPFGKMSQGLTYISEYWATKQND
ncbi:MAG: zf-HC2 domain-containing protein [Firmicutes bacterium]|nr:zf-HC2 domain-containing protein [Bacillota bacterium]